MDSIGVQKSDPAAVAGTSRPSKRAGRACPDPAVAGDGMPAPQQ